MYSSTAKGECYANVNSIKGIRRIQGNPLLAMLAFSPKYFMQLLVWWMCDHILLAMYATEFCIVNMLSFLCDCSLSEFGYFRVQRNCRCCSLLVPWDCWFCLLLTVQHSRDAFTYLNKRRRPSLILKMDCQRYHHCVSKMALMLRAYFVVETIWYRLKVIPVVIGMVKRVIRNFR